MATGAQVWSTTAASNNTIDSQVNWSEGMAPSAVNDSARAEMASVAMFIGDNSGTLATGGTTTAFTISSRQISTGFADGKTIAVRMHATNEANATLNLDGIGPKNIQIYADQNISYGQLTGGSIHRFTYNSASTGWIVNSFPGQNAYLTSLDVVGATSFGAVSMISASISSTLNVSGAVFIGGALRTASLVTTGSANITDTTLIGAAWAAYTPTITSVVRNHQFRKRKWQLFTSWKDCPCQGHNNDHR